MDFGHADPKEMAKQGIGDSESELGSEIGIRSAEMWDRRSAAMWPIHLEMAFFDGDSGGFQAQSMLGWWPGWYGHNNLAPSLEVREMAQN
jgi:hypothetical protein